MTTPWSHLKRKLRLDEWNALIKWRRENKGKGPKHGEERTVVLKFKCFGPSYPGGEYWVVKK